MITSERPNMTAMDDAELVGASRSGDREAFRHIVERYQTVLCSVAYSATGSLSQSEDLAQETFLTAWTHLGELREPGKIRGWLCGILRHHIHRSYRNHKQEPVHGAADLDEAHDSPAEGILPSEAAINREEQAILWRSLEQIPEMYREPLVLYYRQQQSVKMVAVELELTEDVVKQRLARGRKMLQAEVEGFVEQALRRTAPGRQFASAVAAALPAASGPLTAASVGGKSAAAKMGFFGVWILPFLGMFAAMLGQLMVIADTTPDRKLRRKKMVLMILAWGTILGAAWFGEWAVRTAGEHFEWHHRTRFAAMMIYWTVYLMVLMPNMGFFTRTMMPRKGAGNDSGSSPMKPLTLAGSTFGLNIAIFWPLIRQAWMGEDWMGMAILGGIAFGLSAMIFVRARNKSGVELGKVLGPGMAVTFLAALAALNLRADVWVASALGTSVPEAHRQEPLWLLPVLSTVLVAWTGVVMKLCAWRAGAAVVGQ